MANEAKQAAAGCAGVFSGLVAFAAFVIFGGLLLVCGGGALLFDATTPDEPYGPTAPDAPARVEAREAARPVTEYERRYGVPLDEAIAADDAARQAVRDAERAERDAVRAAELEATRATAAEEIAERYRQDAEREASNTEK